MLTATENPRVSETVVVDASVVISILIDPSPSVDALARRVANAHSLAPSILPFEITNVLRRRRNAGLLSPAESSLAFSEAVTLPVDLWPFEILADRIWALGHNLSAYDAAYAALAERVEAPLLTRDRRLANAPGVHCEIEVY